MKPLFSREKLPKYYGKRGNFVRRIIRTSLGLTSCLFLLIVLAMMQRQGRVLIDEPSAFIRGIELIMMAFGVGLFLYETIEIMRESIQERSINS
ncbi:MAG: hypothetical protein ACETWE_14745 [Candidatus Bathyarchaeia archaeon]